MKNIELRVGDKLFTENPKINCPECSRDLEGDELMELMSDPDHECECGCEIEMDILTLFSVKVTGGRVCGDSDHEKG